MNAGQRIGAATTIAAAVALAGAGVAQAAPDATVSVSGNQLAYVASGGAKNNVEITLDGGYYWVDDVVNLTPGAGCGFAPGHDSTVVRCANVGIGSISVYTAGGNDVVDARVHSVWVPMYILGGTGDDLLAGQNGNDVVEGGSDYDRVYGNQGNDLLFGGHRYIEDNTAGNFMVGGGGDDELYGGLKNDVMDGQQGNDYMWGSDGNDDMRGGEGNDKLRGSNNNDTLRGDQGDDILEGGAHNNSVDGGSGSDTCSGGPGFSNCEAVIG
ncbi:calcium-binding protein [Lentzea sp. NPDC051838]|uniref:calcium-binding protein n=1 Tax=Lentzea sp. NPDC051838 TaxID=3154849 RepID=UPI003430F7E3